MCLSSVFIQINAVSFKHYRRILIILLAQCHLEGRLTTRTNYSRDCSMDYYAIY